MLSEFLIASSIIEIKNFILNDLTLFDIALVYVLGYVIYKSLGRYIYFKPQEHESKINRTFLSISIMIIGLYFLGYLADFLPFIKEYRSLFLLASLVLLIAPFSILMFRTVWNSDGNHRYYNYTPVQRDYYKTTIDKIDRINDNSWNDYEVEGVKSTNKNLHSDSLLHFLAILIFLFFSAKWTYLSYETYGLNSIIFSIFICSWITAIYVDQGLFSWMSHRGIKNKLDKLPKPLKKFLMIRN